MYKLITRTKRFSNMTKINSYELLRLAYQLVFIPGNICQIHALITIEEYNLCVCIKIGKAFHLPRIILSNNRIV